MPESEPVDYLADLTEATVLAPAEASPQQALAWLLAVCPQDKVRDGKKALEYAKKACKLSNWQEPACLSAQLSGVGFASPLGR